MKYGEKMSKKKPSKDAIPARDEPEGIGPNAISADANVKKEKKKKASGNAINP